MGRCYVTCSCSARRLKRKRVEKRRRDIGFFGFERHLSPKARAPFLDTVGGYFLDPFGKCVGVLWRRLLFCGGDFCFVAVIQPTYCRSSIIILHDRIDGLDNLRPTKYCHLPYRGPS